MSGIAGRRGRRRCDGYRRENGPDDGPFSAGIGWIEKRETGRGDDGARPRGRDVDEIPFPGTDERFIAQSLVPPMIPISQVRNSLSSSHIEVTFLRNPNFVGGSDASDTNPGRRNTHAASSGAHARDTTYRSRDTGLRGFITSNRVRPTPIRRQLLSIDWP